MTTATITEELINAPVNEFATGQAIIATNLKTTDGAVGITIRHKRHASDNRMVWFPRRHCRVWRVHDPRFPTAEQWRIEIPDWLAEQRGITRLDAYEVA